MIITRLENTGKNKVKVYLDDRYRFTLYDREIKKYGLIEEGNMAETLLNELYNNAIKRAKQKAMALLKHMDRTEAELKRKLEMAGFSGDIIQEAICYVISYHYIDDLRYASSYVRMKKSSKSKRQIIGELQQKGIAGTDIQEALSSEYDSEEEAIQREITKKFADIKSLSREERQKIAAKLYRKGYGMDLIRHYMSLE
ncbi:regulatory protein RecX [Anaerocolumna sp. AGMB13020]|uniref:regulatory protein RecX n=1 Tax=Anaerocolumna sp. AGMB13020 TaxID=3081750 RepID=UPI002955264B|nr:regulatory protein RecX [Anaerocolumna sp. AGMB13020]WOO36910.1 regulatory protein RecX [Anaerocolumna sp. AGMB13020]